jgi:hypothetical protein
MSCIIVPTANIDAAVRVCLKTRPSMSGFSAARCDDFGYKIARMNAQAVAVRYRKPIQPPMAYIYTPPMLTDIGLLKAANCVIYNCAEGDVLHSDIGRILEKAVLTLTQRIVNDLPEYLAAKWEL